MDYHEVLISVLLPLLLCIAYTLGRLDRDHHYLSTACLHGMHTGCRIQCKFCRAVCRCKCHSAALRED
jgi:hypothetical protein